MKNWGIRKQVLTLALLPAAIIAVLLTTTFIVSQISEHTKLLEEKGRILTSQLAVAAEYAVATGNISILENLTSSVLKEPDVAQINITDKEDRLLISVHQQALIKETENLIKFKSPIIQSKTIVSDFENEANDQQDTQIGSANISLSNISTIQRQKQDLVKIVFIVVSGLVIAMIFAMRIGEGVIRPIFKMSSAVTKIAEGQLSTRIEENSKGETRILEKGINNMAKKLQRAHDDMQENIDMATAELRMTMNNLEMMNAELDITRKKAVESSRAKSEFLSNMSHEIRTPMNGVIGFINILKRTKLTEDQTNYINTIHKSTTSLLEIINEILDFSKLDAGKVYLENIDFNLREITEDAILLMAPGAYDKNLNITLIFPSDVPVHLIGDPVKIKQILINLVGNAIKFTNEGSIIICVEAINEDKDNVKINISAKDTGIGISKENQKNIFSEFTQADSSISRNFGGTGLGLGICKKIVELMDGKMGMESNPGQGSSFWFEFSCNKRKNPLQKSSLPVQPFASVNCILYGQHEPSRTSLYHQLTSWGMMVIDFNSLSSIGKYLKTCSPDQNKFDIAVISINSNESDNPNLQSTISDIKEKFNAACLVLVNSNNRSLIESIYKLGADSCLQAITPQLRLYKSLHKLLSQKEHETPIHTCFDARSTNVVMGLKHQILVVDDNEINRQVITHLLKEAGATVTEAKNGKEAVDLCANKQFDLIFMDIHMPIMDGQTATRKIRDAETGSNQTPIIAMTADVMSRKREKFIQSRMNDCIIKPLDENDVWGVIIKWLDPEIMFLDNSLDILRRPGPHQDSPFTPDNNTTEAFSDHNILTIDKHPCFESKFINYRKALQISGGNRHLTAQLFSRFIEEIPDRKSKINSFFAKSQLDKLRDEVHKIYRSAQYCAANKIGDSASALERAIENNHNNIGEMIKDLNKHINELLDEQSGFRA
ncbi:MAG: response regulator [Gammaproteobacteria bacterium]|nr:response regulator [Gammaproteobacteria bacterium]